jgi:signal transduction histidine kinase
MKDGRKTTSIARRIAWRFQWKKLWQICWHTLFLAAAAVVSWCAAMAQIASGGGSISGSWHFQLGTDLTSLTQQPLWQEWLWQELQGQSVFHRLVIFDMGDGQIAYMGDFLFWLCLVLGALFSLRLILWLLSGLGATGRIRRYLKPIDDIAQVTESISARGFDESKFHSLEEAIDHINGASADEKLQIGDDDLAGLETAVNNLIVRMHNGYRQQVRFVDDASHELRTPIAVIAGYADMLDRWGKTDPQVLDESIRAIQTETEHMKTLVEQLLFLARGDAGRQTFSPVRLELSALIHEVWEESSMIDSDHRYILQAPDPLFVRGDEALLKQAVRILVDNSRKYSPVGSSITLRAYPSENDACIDVQDNGIGVSQDDALHMFDRFYRSNAVRGSQTGGSGLGLSIAKWIVGKHRGRFHVTSYEDIGTRITILLPLDK